MIPITKKLELAHAIMAAEKNGMDDHLKNLGNDVLTIVHALESLGKIEEAREFELFIPIDEDYLSFLAPLLGAEEYAKTIRDYKAEKEEKRLAFIAKYTS